MSANRGVVAAFRKLLRLSNEELFVPENHRVMGAIGAAFLAQEQVERTTSFDLVDLAGRLWTHSVRAELKRRRSRSPRERARDCRRSAP